MSQPKIIFLDIDGTLVGRHMNVPDSAVTAIRGARKNGHKVYLTTGRSKAEVYPYLWDIGFDGLIGGNGASVESGGVNIMHQTIASPVIKHTVDWLLSKQIGFFEESDEGLYASEHFLSEAAGIFGEGPEAGTAKIRHLFPKMIYGEELYRDGLNKISFIMKDGVSLEEIRYEFEKHFIVDTWSLTGKKEEFCELGQLGIHKGKAVETILAHLGAHKEDTMAFGDGRNDIEMIKFCHIGVAMENAKPELKEVADYITSDVDADGIYNGFKHFGLID